MSSKYFFDEKVEPFCGCSTVEFEEMLGELIPRTSLKTPIVKTSKNLEFIVFSEAPLRRFQLLHINYRGLVDGVYHLEAFAYFPHAHGDGQVYYYVGWSIIEFNWEKGFFSLIEHMGRSGIPLPEVADVEFKYPGLEDKSGNWANLMI